MLKKALNQKEYDVVITDVNLPGINGIELTTYVHKNFKHIDIIVITANKDTNLAVRAIKNGAFDFITKPFKTSVVQHVLNRVLEKRHLEEMLQHQHTDSSSTPEMVIELEKQLQNVVFLLGNTIEAKDGYTKGHTNRVAKLTYMLAQELGWSEDKMMGVWMGGALHDVGKIGIPDHILKKPARLTKEEYEIMKTHPQIGYELVKGNSFF